jgi:hypothetical protein
MLNEFVAVTGYHRKYAIRLLNGPLPAAAPPRPRPPGHRRPAHGLDGRRLPLVAAPQGPAAPVAAAFAPAAPSLAEARAPALDHQPRQIDRRLAGHRRQLTKRLYGRTKPGTLLKHHIPLKTDRWDVRTPGFSEIDLVSHSGTSADGEHIHSLNLTDIHTTWVETAAVLGKGAAGIGRTLDDLRQALPFRLRGIDSDNGAEFINASLYDYCQTQGIQFTRGRPYKKDDNAHIEQKNWTHVRKLLGYVRYDTPAALTAINDLYRHELRLLQNLFLPSVKLVRKERVGARVRRRYDAPRTPLERVRACPDADGAKVAALTALRDRLDPFALARTIDQKLERLYALANHRQSPPPVAPGEPPLPVVPTKRQPERLRDMRFGKHITNYDRRRMVTS